MSGAAAALVPGGVAAGAVLLAAAAVRPVAGAIARRRAHHRTGRVAPDPSAEPVDRVDAEGAHLGPAPTWSSAGARLGGGRSGWGRNEERRPSRLHRQVDRRLRGGEASLRAAFVAADLDLDVTTAVRTWAGGAAAGFLVALARWGPAGAVVASLLAVGLPIGVLAWRRGRAAQRMATALPGMLESVAGRLRAGASLAEAVSTAADEPSGSALLDVDLHDLRRRVAHGQPFTEAVGEWARRRPVPGVALVAAALVLGAEAGGARARAIDGVATTLRERRAVAGEVDALSTQARASALVMMGAPVAFAALGLLSDPEVSHFLLATPAGLACLTVGLGLDALAGWWMVLIARGAR